MLTQQEVEELMVTGGRERALASFTRNEEKGTAHNNPYASAVYSRFIMPLAEMIEAYTSNKARGVAAASKGLLRRIDSQAAAFLTVRQCLDLGNLDSKNPATAVSRAVGQTIYGEVLLQEFENIEPDLYFTLVKDFERRMTKSERHRLTVFKMQAAKQGINLPEYSPEDKLATGTILIYMAKELGLVELEEVREGKKYKRHMVLTPEVKHLLDSVKDQVAGMMPQMLPCVAPPRDWVTPNDGGYHTPAMRRLAPCCIRGRPRVMDEADVPEIPLRALNILQSRPWRINQRVLDTIDLVKDRFDVGEVLAQADLPKPHKPDFLDLDMPVADMTPVQVATFKAWKAEMREWYTTSKERGIKWGRFWQALRVARQFKDETIWFVYQYDYRGRAYANTRGVSPQGSDLQKALIMAADGRRIEDDTAKFWFYSAGANRYGFDKADLEDRYQWTVDRHDLILAIAADPVAHRQWTDADNPFQFLAWCFEFADYQANPATFVSRLALGQDGSCNGLQHFSAMLRDSVGGLATNLVPSSSQQDIYRLVAEATGRGLSLLPPEGMFTLRWQQHSLSRDLVKRSVMTLPYGSTRFSCADFIFKEYMAKGKAPEFSPEEHRPAARWLSVAVWDAIGEVVVKAREAMEWLQDSSDELIEAGLDEINWRSPSGFMVRQRYGIVETTQVTTRIAGGVRIRPRIRQEKQEPCKRRHRNGIAPNFVHSHDAAHMHLLICWADDHGLGHLHFIHDDYGTTPDGTEALHKGIRATFVEMYERTSPLEDFKRRNDVTAPVPENGDLDIRVVVESRYFFA